MQYSPKLKKAMEQIKEIIKEHDIAAFVVIHDKSGFSEFLNSVSPSYSCAFIENGALRFRLKESEVGKENARILANGTYSMVNKFAEIIGSYAMLYIDSEKLLKEKWRGEQYPGGQTSHEQQNN